MCGEHALDSDRESFAGDGAGDLGEGGGWFFFRSLFFSFPPPFPLSSSLSLFISLFRYGYGGVKEA